MNRGSNREQAKPATSEGWLAASTTERTRGLISAINTLTVDSKLRMAGISNPRNQQDVVSARRRLREFVSRLFTLLEDAQRHKGQPVLGADPQLSQIVRGLARQPQKQRGTVLSVDSIGKLGDLLSTSEPSDPGRLVEDLRALRQLLERYSRRDVRIR